MLAACTGRRAYLRIVILINLDTALRPTELLRLKPGAIDLEGKVIEAYATTTKTNRKRFVPISDRTVEALRDWFDGEYETWSKLARRGPVIALDPDPTIFANIQGIGMAWRAACDKAGIENLQFKDLRHWATTLMVDTGLPAKHIMKITGHTQEKTFRRYINTDKEVVRQVGELVEQLRLAREEKEKKGEGGGGFVN